MFFPDAHTMHEGTIAPNLYYFNRSTPPKSAEQIVASTKRTDESSAAKPYSLSILTETHINIIVKSEDYGRRQCKKEEQQRFAKILVNFSSKKGFLMERQKQLNQICDQETHKRKEIQDEELSIYLRLDQQRQKDRLQAQRNEEVFPKGILLGRGESIDLGFASIQSALVDLRWSGADGEAAALAVLAFDAYDRFITTIAPGESFRCPISGKPVIRSWGQFRFKSGHDDPATDPNRLSIEHRTTLELLLHNLSPQCTIQRFVFVALNPKTTGGALTAIRRAYLTIREPNVFMGKQGDLCPLEGVRSPGATPTSRIGKVQTDTVTTEVASSRLADHPAAACYTIGSVVRQCSSGFDLEHVDSSTLGRTLTSGALSVQSSVDDRGLRPPSGRHLRSARAMHTVSPFQRPIHLDDRASLTSSPVGAAVEQDTHGGSGGTWKMSRSSRQPSAGSRMAAVVTSWKYVCHDLCDHTVPNIHRLPGVLESVLFINADDVWYAYTQAVGKLLRATEEFYEKIFRVNIEICERCDRNHLSQRSGTDRDLVVKLTSINPLKAAMMKSKHHAQDVGATSPAGQYLQPTPPAGGASTPRSRRRSGWSATLNVVKASVSLNKSGKAGR
jgi:hypothetical protein